MIISFAVLLLLFAIAVGLVAAYGLYTIFRDTVPYVPTSSWVVAWMAEHADLPGGGTVVDLGCGDGRVLRAMKRHHPDIQAIGYEINWIPYLLGRRKNKRAGVEIRRKSFYAADLTGTNVVYCYLLNSLMPKVQDILTRQLSSGSLIYSHVFRFPDWTPIATIPNPEPDKKSPLLVYRIP